MLHVCLAEGFYQTSSLVSSVVPISGKAVNRAWAIQPRSSRPGYPVLGQGTQDQQLMRSLFSFLWISNVVGFQTLKFQLQVFYRGFVDNVITITQDLRRYRTGENLCMAFVTTHCLLVLWPCDSFNGEVPGSSLLKILHVSWGNCFVKPALYNPICTQNRYRCHTDDNLLSWLETARSCPKEVDPEIQDGIDLHPRSKVLVVRSTVTMRWRYLMYITLTAENLSEW